MNDRERSEITIPPNDPFSVRFVGDPEFMFGLAKGLYSVDPALDRYSPRGILSETVFTDHPIFQREITRMVSTKQIGIQFEQLATFMRDLLGRDIEHEPRFTIRSTLFLTGDYMAQENRGFFSSRMADQLAEDVEDRMREHIVDELISPRSNFEIPDIQKGAVVQVDLGYPSSEVAELAYLKGGLINDLDNNGYLDYSMEENARLVAALNADEYLDFIDRQNFGVQDQYRTLVRTLISSFNRPPSESEEILYDRPSGQEMSNTSVNIHLYGAETYYGTNARYHLAGLLGVPLSSPEALEKVLEFYALCFEAIVDTICKMEGVNLQGQRVLIGSNLPK